VEVSVAAWPETAGVVTEIAEKLAQWAGGRSPEELRPVEAEGTRRLAELAESVSKRALAAYAEGDLATGRRDEDVLRQLSEIAPDAFGSDALGDVRRGVGAERTRLEKRGEEVRLVLTRLDALDKAFASSSPRLWLSVLNTWARSAPPASAWNDTAVKSRWGAVAARMRKALSACIASGSTAEQLDEAAAAIVAAKATVLAGELRLASLERSLRAGREAIRKEPPPAPPTPPTPPTSPGPTPLAASAALPLTVKNRMSEV